jgi:UPF0755 protein
VRAVLSRVVRVLVLTLALVALIAGGAGGYLYVRQQLAEPMHLPDGELLLEVRPGDSLRTVAGRLQATGVLPRKEALLLFGRWTGAAARIKAGEYAIAPGTTPRSLLDLLVSGDVRLHAVTLIEGWTLAEALAAIQAHDAVRVTLERRDLPAIADLLGVTPQSAEGWLFPDTYSFPRGTTDAELIRIAHERMQGELQAAWQGRAPDLPLEGPYQALILASIVEKETGLASERPRIAGVFIRRLRTGMKLQTDPTVIYGLGANFDGDLRRADLRADTPYNTYTRYGLPPTPIALPGAASLAAVTRPDDSGALFFVASPRGDGSHLFSATLAAHNAAVRDLVRGTRGATP